MAQAAIPVGNTGTVMTAESSVGDEDPSTLVNMAIVSIGIETRSGMEALQKLRQEAASFGGRWLLVDTRIFVPAIAPACSQWQDGKDPYIQRLVLEKTEIVQMCQNIFENLRHDGVRNLIIACRTGRFMSDVISRILTEFINHVGVDSKRYYNAMRWSLATVGDAREFHTIMDNIRQWPGSL